MRIQVVPYDPQWPDQFARIREELAAILSDFHPVIEHIGSTSVPGLAAKPIIDIAVGLERAEDHDLTVEPMSANHYMYYEAFNADMPDRRLFVGLKDPGIASQFRAVYSDLDDIPHEAINEYRLSHIHIREYGTSEWTRHLAFRDYLRAHPDVCNAYGKLKMQLSERDWEDGMAYNAAKEAFVMEVERMALGWY